ncbi:MULTISPECIES: DUF6105 family protein [Rhizobium]|uniref:DUF6105 family protein n=1 Tax=Rhizobium TaxID=379 RepID=UPI0007E97278|nr:MULTISPECIES: DUF6105 family protein [Rhizobium]ANK91380.1 hypothetical protein AMK01_CH01913 [Rhizobium sp. N6212]ANK97413.1 hypothetical protein AMK00_CH01915 [Rhizobium sp. N621]ANL03533.1 hypothetical protein AMJ99_CH01983 [Rhizobium esperanzae]ANL09579.1 hypothetical protein AMJ98_CH01905 [Rhizobium sp. N1341]ANL21630.1 hypothetical protein AMJ96_CH01910 [Rhizobium sp. N113]
MKWFLVFWAGPIVFLGAWYWLSYYDMNFGIFMLTRQVHDLTFEIYGEALGIPAETIPPLVARAIAVDSLVVFAILGFRKRKLIAAWWKARQALNSSPADLASDDSLSRAP